jgi:hypothetical protein
VSAAERSVEAHPAKQPTRVGVNGSFRLAGPLASKLGDELTKRLRHLERLASEADRHALAGDVNVIGGHGEDPRERLAEHQHQAPGDTVAKIEAGVTQKTADRRDSLSSQSGGVCRRGCERRSASRAITPPRVAPPRRGAIRKMALDRSLLQRPPRTATLSFRQLGPSDVFDGDGRYPDHGEDHPHCHC